jgi:hypothetical protein
VELAKSITGLLLAALFLLCSLSALAQDTTITYQGQLRQGTATFSGTVNLEFRLFDQVSGGSQVGPTQTRNSWPVEGGLFQVELDFGADAFTSQVRYLEVRVDGTTLEPRQAVRPAPMALFALAGNPEPPGDSHWLINGTATYYNAGKVGVGTADPDHQLTIQSAATVKVLGLRGPNTAMSGARLSFGDAEYVFIEEDVDDFLRIHSTQGTRFTGGNVGINTSNPQWPLDVVATQAVGRFTSTLSTSGSVIELRNNANPQTSVGAINFVNNAGQFRGQIAYSSADDLTFRVGGGERVRIDTNGRMGIGTAAPSSPLHVLASARAIYAVSSNGSTGVIRANETSASGQVMGVWGETTSTSGRGVQGYATATSGPAAGVWGVSDSTAGFGVLGWTTANTGVNYGVWGASDSASGFDFYAAGAGTNYGSASSARWKRNVQPIEQPLDMLARLRGVYFDWDAAHGGHHDVGMIAEEVGAVLPEIVQYEANGIDAIGLDYSKLTPLLTAAVNALREEKDTEIAVLVDELAQVKIELQALREELGRSK